MAKRDTSSEALGANVLQECKRERCGYVVYGDPKSSDEVARSKELIKDHERQHTDPDGWKADAEKAAKAESKR
jgi:hypothetical protein